MCQLKENGTFVETNAVFQINKEFLKEPPVFTTAFIGCNKCGERAIGYDELGLPWCYTPTSHPEDIFPMHREIIYQLEKIT